MQAQGLWQLSNRGGGTHHHYTPLDLFENDQTPQSNTHFSANAPAGSNVRIYWGDGDFETLATGVKTYYDHDYASAGTYTISISGDYEAEGLELYFNEATLSGDIANFAPLTGLIVLRLGTSVMTGDLADLAPLTALRQLELYDSSGVVGEVSDLAGMADLEHVNLRNTSVSGDIADVAPLVDLWSLRLNGSDVDTYTTPTTLPTFAGDTGSHTADIQIQDLGLSTAEVDGFLNDLIAVSRPAAGTLHIDGTNAARSAASLSAKIDLLADGWVLYLNE